MCIVQLQPRNSDRPSLAVIALQIEGGASCLQHIEHRDERIDAQTARPAEFARPSTGPTHGSLQAAGGIKNGYAMLFGVEYHNFAMRSSGDASDRTERYIIAIHSQAQAQDLPHRQLFGRSLRSELIGKREQHE